jgi:prephenate dehydratase
MGEYIFLVDFEGDSRDARVQKALKQVKESTTFLHMLGTYRVLPKLC